MTPPPLADGFEVEGRVFPWGTLFADAVTDLGDANRIAQSDGSATYGDSRVFGMAVTSVRLDAAGDDRPVTGLWCELPPHPGFRLDPDAVLVARVAQVFGPPEAEDHYGGEHPGEVRHTADWTFGPVTLGLSIYGAAREEPGGLSCGCLYLTWQDTASAAEPFLADYDAAAAQLEAELQAAEVLETVTLAYDREADDDSFDPEAARSSLALSAAPRLLTPPVLSDHLASGQAALWRGPSSWGLSTRRYTVRFPLGAEVSVSRSEIKPAKAGGHSMLEVDGLSLMDVHGSQAIALLAGRLAAEGLATIDLHEGYDV